MPYGSSHLHIVAPVQQLGQYIANGSFDAVSLTLQLQAASSPAVQASLKAYWSSISQS